jgi:riboflavin transporter FmnP
MSRLSRSRRISLVALFTALAFVLNLAIAFPAPYEPFLFYEVWEIPILVAVIILGLKEGLTVAVLNTLLLEAYRPGSLPAAPFYNLIAQLAMFAGVLLAARSVKSKPWGIGALVALATFAGAVVRTGVMTVVNYIVLPLPYPVGFAIPAAAVPPFLVPIGVFNFTIALYTVPLAYSLAKAVETRYGRDFGDSVSRTPTHPSPGR